MESKKRFFDFAEFLNPQGIQMVINLTNYFTRHDDMAITTEDRLRKVLEALGISYSSVRNIIREKNANVVPKKAGKRKRKNPKTEDLRETQKMDVRHTIYNLYAKKIPVTLKSLKDVLKE